MDDSDRNNYERYEGAGERDLLIGFATLGAMILAALIVTVIAALT